MPLYEYRCDACERRFDLLTTHAQREAGHPCPDCGSTATRVLPSRFAVSGLVQVAPVATPGQRPAGGGCCGGACGCGH